MSSRYSCENCRFIEDECLGTGCCGNKQSPRYEDIVDDSDRCRMHSSGVFNKSCGRADDEEDEAVDYGDIDDDLPEYTIDGDDNA